MPIKGTRTVSPLSDGCGPKLVENDVTGIRFAVKGMSAFWATLMSLTLVRVLDMAVC